MPQANIGVIRNLCAAFLFRGDTVDKHIASSPAARRAGWCWPPCWPGR